MITDQEILSYFLKSNGHVNVQRLTNISEEYKEYLVNRYTDSQSLRETIKRIQYNIEVRPVCVICGKPVKFLNGKKNQLFNKTYCKEHANMLDGITVKKVLKDIYSDVNKKQEINNKIRETCLLKRELTSSYKEEFYKIYKEELKTVLKQINVPIIHIDINNDLKDVAYSCYKSYIKSVKKADLNEEIVKLSKTYESDGEYVDLLISEIFTNDEIDKMIDNIKITPFTGYLDYDILEYINKNYYNKIIDLTKNKMADATYAYRTIIRECSEYNKNQKLYIIGKHNQSHYFCDQKDVDKININLNNRKLICTYTKKSKHLKYRWPSDAPYVVTELTRQVIFDVDNNSVCDFNESENTYEISRDKYY